MAQSVTVTDPNFLVRDWQFEDAFETYPFETEGVVPGTGSKAGSGKNVRRLVNRSLRNLPTNDVRRLANRNLRNLPTNDVRRLGNRHLRNL